MNLIIYIVIFGAAIFVCVLWALEDRELRRTFLLFGTTGFYDVDQHFHHIPPDGT